MHTIRIGKKQDQRDNRRALRQHGHDFIGEKGIRRNNEVWLHVIQQGIELAAHQLCEHAVRQQCSPGCIEELELRRPQPERVTTHNAIVPMEEARLRINNGDS